MNLQTRIALLVRLGHYMLSSDEQWRLAQHRAFLENNWFIPEFIELSVQNIAHSFLQPEKLNEFIHDYSPPETNPAPKRVGIVMAGNIPLVGFHDFLCVFLSGHIAFIKASSKDEVLIKHLVNKLTEWEDEVANWVQFGVMLKGCDAYIATGSNNTSRYFDFYFNKYPHIIRKNRTSVAILTGNESREELEKLADDVYQFFGLGCRNVTKLFVPKGYDFIPLLHAFNKYQYLINHHKYKNNYDYHLAVHILNNHFYMTNGSIMLVENSSPFSPISQLNYEYYTDKEKVRKELHDNDAIQCTVGDEMTAFGDAQNPRICDFADRTDTMKFLAELNSKTGN